MLNSKSPFAGHRSKLVPLLLVALSLALNLHALAADSFWGDEILTAIFAGRSPAEVIRWTAGDIHPPFYYLLAGAFTRLTVPLGATGDPTAASDWLWRFPSVVAVVLTIAVTYRLAFYASRPPLVSPSIQGTVAISAPLLLTLAPIVIEYGQEARMHALFMFLSALSTWLFFRAMAKPDRWSRWLAFGLATTANIYTMYFGFLILAAQAAFLIFALLDRKHLSIYAPPFLGFLSATILTFIFYLPWWPVLFDILRKRAATGAVEGGVGHPLAFLRGLVQALGPTPEPAAWAFLLLFISGLLLMAKRYWPMAAFAGLWLTLPAALPIVLGDPRALQFRYAFVLPVYLIVITYAVVICSSFVQSKVPNFPSGPLSIYLVWLLATLSFIATLGVYAQTKPNWRGAAAYLERHAAPADLVLIGPLWDEGRFIGYYYRGQAQLLTPAALVTNIERRVESLRASGGRIWAVNRFAPTQSALMENVAFPGVVLSEPMMPVYEPALLTEAAINLAEQAVEAAYPWAARAEAQGILNPDPRTARAAALQALGDTLVAAGRAEEALIPYQTAVDIFPGWPDGFIALAETQEAVGNLPAATEAYRQAVIYNPKWQGPLAEEAATLAKTGQWDAALEKYHQIIKN